MPKASIIKGKRLYLRGLEKNDASQNYCNWLNDPKVNCFLETRYVEHDLNSIRAFISNKNASDDEYLMGIFECKNDRHVGNIKIGPIRSHHCLADVSLFIGDRSVWGKGYASESIVIATNFAFINLKLRKLNASIYENNVASIRAFSKAGWSQEANLPKHYLFNGKETNIVIMGIRP